MGVRKPMLTDEQWERIFKDPHDRGCRHRLAGASYRTILELGEGDSLEIVVGIILFTNPS
jgi:hypothetical protein